MRVYRAQQFKRWVDDLVATAKEGDAYAIAMARHVLDGLNYIKVLDREPGEDTATLKRVRQVVVLFAADKAPMGDVFYNSVGSRADQEIDKWKNETQGKR